MNRCHVCGEVQEMAEGFEKGDVINCPSCEEELEVVEVDPELEVGPIPPGEEEGE